MKSIRSIFRIWILDILSIFYFKIKPGVYILNGHYISPKNFISNHQFEKLINDLSKRYTLINIEVAIDMINNPIINIDKPYLALTFDDGFEECYTKIAPILDRYNINCAFFIVPNFVEGNNDYIKNMEELTIEEKNIMVTIESYISIYKNIIKFLINHKDFKYEKKIDYINECSDCIEYISEILNKNKIKKNGIESIYLFTNILSEKEIKVLDFFKILDEFIKKINMKKKIDENMIKNKLYNEEINILIMNNEFNKVIEKIFT